MIEELYLFYDCKKSNRKNLRPNLCFFANAKCYMDWKEEYMNGKGWRVALIIVPMQTRGWI